LQLTLPHTIAVALTVVVPIAVVLTVVAITVVYALEWRQVLPSAPLRSVPLPRVRTTRHVITRHAADTTLTHRAISPTTLLVPIGPMMVASEANVVE
jgi:hypothetical protein